MDSRDAGLMRRWSHTMCGTFYVSSEDERMMSDHAARQTWHPDRIIALLNERALQLPNAPIPLLQFDGNENLPNTAPLRVRELLATWPKTASEKVRRAFLNLVRKGGGGLNSTVSIDKSSPETHLFLCEQGELRALLDAFCNEYGWMKKLPEAASTFAPDRYVITPAGWTKFEELAENDVNSGNPVFVAMWFGGKDPEIQVKQRTFFEQLRTICKSNGWLAERSDTPEHNDSIIDRILFMIRRAPFVVADLSDENHGAYYEAGFARGLGREVIYLVREGTKVHFDLTGVNQVRWKDHAELRQTLENRILGTVGRGPHKFDEM